jgi:hypothetical protein
MGDPTAIAFLCPIDSLLICDAWALSGLTVVPTLSYRSTRAVAMTSQSMVVRPLSFPTAVIRRSAREVDLFSTMMAEADLSTLAVPLGLVNRLDDRTEARVEVRSGYAVLLAVGNDGRVPPEDAAALIDRAAATGHCRVGEVDDDWPMRMPGICVRVEPGTYELAYGSQLIDVEADSSNELYRMRPYRGTNA